MQCPQRLDHPPSHRSSSTRHTHRHTHRCQLLALACVAGRVATTAQAQIGEFLMANFSNEWPIYAADGLPLLADSDDEAAKLYKAQQPLLAKKLAEQGMLLLYAVAWPPQGIFAKKPINSTADLKGVKWRAYSPSTGRIAGLVGAQAVAVQAAELRQAMATGVVESNMSSGSTGYHSKTYAHLKCFMDTQAWLPKNAVLVNRAAFDALDAPSKAALLKANADAETRGWATSKAKNTAYLDLLKQSGMAIVTPTPQLKADMKKVGDTMLKKWLDTAGPEGKALIDAFDNKQATAMRRAACAGCALQRCGCPGRAVFGGAVFGGAVFGGAVGHGGAGHGRDLAHRATGRH